jgi:glycosyltransferase involved in cell wall biosynthesis
MIPPRVAVIHDWLEGYTGSERVLEQILQTFPTADLFTAVDALKQRDFLQGRKVKTSFAQHLPFVQRKFRAYLPLLPAAVESLDFSDYDLIISSSHAIAKGIMTYPEQLHICYLQSRNLKYAYDDRRHFRQSSGGGLRTSIEDILLSYMRLWDSVASKRPDVTIANSRYVSTWHEHRHGVTSTVIYPPVDVNFFLQFQSQGPKQDYYVLVCRLEPYKRVDLAIAACNRLNKPLMIIGDGTQRANLERIAGSKVTFMGYQDKAAIAKVLTSAKAFLFPSCEDFGIAPVEAQACGIPVIAYAKGGGLETINGLETDRPTGLWFREQTEESLIAAIEAFEKVARNFDPNVARENARRFHPERFRNELKDYVSSCWQAHTQKKELL